MDLRRTGLRGAPNDVRVFFFFAINVHGNTRYSKNGIPDQTDGICTLFQTKTAKYIPYFRLEMLENDTLWGGTYLYGLYMGGPPPPPPGILQEGISWNQWHAIRALPFTAVPNSYSLRQSFCIPAVMSGGSEIMQSWCPYVIAFSCLCRCSFICRLVVLFVCSVFFFSMTRDTMGGPRTGRWNSLETTLGQDIVPTSRAGDKQEVKWLRTWRRGGIVTSGPTAKVTSPLVYVRARRTAR